MHTWKYRYSEKIMENVGITFEIEDETTLPAMLEFFESYLRAVGYSFEGGLEINNTMNSSKENVDAV